METVAQPPADAELHLLTDWSEPGGSARHRKAAALSLLFHVVFIMAVAATSKILFAPPKSMTESPVVTPLIAPPLTALTQKAPNNGKITKEFNIAESQPRPRIQAPARAPEPSPVPQFRPAPPAPPAPKPIDIPEPPKVQMPTARTDVALAMPQIQQVEKPPLAFENPVAPPAVQPGQGLPIPSVADAIRGAGRGGGATVNVPQSPGVQPSAMQLLSDPMGVDFAPYLRQILATVTRYWQAVWPDAARRGATGKVALQFTIDRSGGVPKLVYVEQSGQTALDRAAVAAISGSVPFPPFPKEYKGQTIALQLNFSYYSLANR